jgi:hypothetical protein
VPIWFIKWLTDYGEEKWSYVTCELIKHVILR